MSPASSSGTTTPPPQTPNNPHKAQKCHSDKSAAGKNKRPLEDSSSALGRALLLNGTEGLPQFLRKKVAFREATHSESLKGIVSKGASSESGSRSSYISYTATVAGNKKSKTGSDTLESEAADARDLRYGFKGGQVDLFPKERLEPFLKWSRIRSIGPGLINLGNTCFLNSVLQCLFYTVPLAEFSLAKEHSKRCRATRDEFCGFCSLERLMQRVHLSQSSSSTSESVLRPIELVSRLKAVGKHFRPGRQEDAHEFLRLFIETLQKASLGKGAGDPVKLDPRSKETTVVHRIFGGYLQSTVTCSACRHISRTFDQFLDLSLDVNRADSLQGALKVFTTPELLSKGNRYKCEACHRLVEAHKQFSLYKTPEIMTIQLKRFAVNPFTGQASKINRPVTFPEHLNVSEWISDKTDSGARYRLYGVIVHEGHSCNSGHYHAFVRSSTNVWYSMNDCSVRQVSLDTVLRQRAYILFYQKNSQEVETAERVPSAKANMTASDCGEKRAAKSMDEKMAALREASRAYINNRKLIDTSATIVPPQSQSQDVNIESESEPESIESVPDLVSCDSSSELRSSSMWHMTPISDDSYNPNHPTLSSKRIKYNFSTSWRVSKIIAKNQ